MSDSKDSSLYMGPAWRYAGRGVILNPAFWPSLLLAMFSFSPGFQNLVYHFFAEKPGAMRNMMVSYYRFQRDYHAGWFLLILLICFVTWAVLRKITTRYTMETDCLFVAEGIMHRYTNTIAKTLIYDCDISQDFFQLCFGTGDLIIRTVDHQVIRLKFVPEPEKWRNAIMSRSSVNDARLLGTI